MGLVGATAYIIGNIVGSGIFVAPAEILGYVELGTSIRRSGCDFAYLCYVKWYPVAFAFMCISSLLANPATLAIQMDAFSEYVFQGAKIRLESENATYYAKKLTGFALVWALLFLNFFSVKSAVSRFQVIATLAQICASSLVIGTGFYYLVIRGDTMNLKNPFADSSFAPGSMVSAFYAGLYAYDGWDILCFGAEEIEKPRRTMKLANINGIVIVALLFMAMNVAFCTVLTKEEMLGNNAIAATFAQKTLGDFQYVMPLCIAILLIASINSMLFASSRLLYVAARQRHLPSFLSCVSKHVDSPRAALVCYVFIAMAVSFIGNLATLLNYAGFSYWIQRLMTIIALFYIRLRHVHPEAIRTPIIVPGVFFIICLALTVTTVVRKWSTAVVGLGVIFVGLMVFARQQRPSLRSR
ncbi:CRE-AAT-6 protein [Aphelenchoides avenae]|nr:CRE-AAT-6 protein [Aphelenchus avenae]